MLTKESIVRLLETDDRAIARALLVLTARQTNDEQASEQTKYLNGRGYRPCHARMGASMSKFFERNGYLSPKQIAYWRGRDKTGAMRIGIYAGQLLEEAEVKAKKKAITMLPGLTGSPYPTPSKQTRDYGNDMEHRMILAEQLGEAMDSDDPNIIDPIAEQISEIDKFWERIRKQHE